jgi:hypothetical protein
VVEEEGRDGSWWEDRAHACLTATGMMQLIGGWDWLVRGPAVATLDCDS